MRYMNLMIACVCVRAFLSSSLCRDGQADCMNEIYAQHQFSVFPPSMSVLRRHEVVEIEKTKFNHFRN